MWLYQAVDSLYVSLRPNEGTQISVKHRRFVDGAVPPGFALHESGRLRTAIRGNWRHCGACSCTRQSMGYMLALGQTKGHREESNIADSSTGQSRHDSLCTRGRLRTALRGNWRYLGACGCTRQSMGYMLAFSQTNGPREESNVADSSTEQSC